MNSAQRATSDSRNNNAPPRLIGKDSDENDMGRVGIYLRVSTQKQTIEQQEEELRLLARVYQLDLTDALRYEDHDKSAFNPKYYRIQDRPEGSKMWADMESGLLDTLVILEVDRCWRHGSTGVTEAEYITNPKKNPKGENGLGIRLVLALGGCTTVDLTTSSGFFAFWGAMGSAQKEVMQTRERVIRKQKTNTRIGKANTGKCFGWNKVEGGMIEPNYDELAVLATFIHETTGRWGKSASSVAKKFNRLGVKTATSNTNPDAKFTGGSLSRPLTSDTHLRHAPELATRYVNHPILGKVRIGFDEVVRPDVRQRLAQEARSAKALSY